MICRNLVRKTILYKFMNTESANIRYSLVKVGNGWLGALKNFKCVQELITGYGFNRILFSEHATANTIGTILLEL